MESSQTKCPNIVLAVPETARLKARLTLLAQLYGLAGLHAINQECDSASQHRFAYR